MTTQTVSDAFWVCLYGLMLIAVLDLSYAILQRSTYYYKYQQIQSASSFISCYQSMI